MRGRKFTIDPNRATRLPVAVVTTMPPAPGFATYSLLGLSSRPPTEVAPRTRM